MLSRLASSIIPTRSSFKVDTRGEPNDTLPRCGEYNTVVDECRPVSGHSSGLRVLRVDRVSDDRQAASPNQASRLCLPLLLSRIVRNTVTRVPEHAVEPFVIKS